MITIIAWKLRTHIDTVTLIDFPALVIKIKSSLSPREKYAYVRDTKLGSFEACITHGGEKC